MKKLLLRVILSGVALYVAQRYLAGFQLAEGWQTLLIGAVVLALLHTFIRPVARVIFKPLIWITLGLFNIVINMGILWLADTLLIQLNIADKKTLFIASFLTALANIL